MPIKVLIPVLLSIILQYCVVVLIYYFLFRIIKMLYLELKADPSPALSLQPAGLPPQRASLLVLDSGSSNLQAFRYYIGETMTIGRNSSNHLIIDDGFVSYEHACISQYKAGYWLTDLNSTNRTYLNGQLITDEVALHHGDIIKIGTVTLKFER